MNQLTRPITTNEETDLSFGGVSYIKHGVIHKIFSFVFGESDDLATLNKIKQNIHLLQENKFMQ